MKGLKHIPDDAALLVSVRNPMSDCGEVFISHIRTL